MKENQQVGWIDYHNIQLSGYDFCMEGMMLMFLTNPFHMFTEVLDLGSTTPNTIPITTRNRIISMIRAKPDILALEAQ